MRIVRFKQLAERGITWTREYVRRLEQAGRFPMHVNIGAHSIGWIEEEITAWLEARVAESRAAQRPPATLDAPGRPKVSEAKARPRERLRHEPAGR